MRNLEKKKLLIVVILVAVVAVLLILIANLQKDQNVCSTCDGGSVSSGDGYVTLGEYTGGEYGDDKNAWARKCDYKGNRSKASSVTIQVEVLQKDGKWKAIDSTGWNLSGSGAGVFYIDYKPSKGGSVIRNKGTRTTRLKAADVSGSRYVGHGSISGTNVLLRGSKRALAVFLYDKKNGTLGKVDDIIAKYDEPSGLLKYQSAIAVTLVLNKDKHY